MTQNKINKNKKTFFAFTLVELIVVIVILAILATIAFVSFNSYSAWSRDSKKMSNVALIAKWFEVAIVQWKTIVTSETALVPNIMLSWSTIKYFWFYDSPVWQKLLKSIGIWWWDINQTSEWYENYKFTYVPSIQKYQVSWQLENPFKLSFYENLNNLKLDYSSLYDWVFADTWSGYIFLKWNYFATWWIDWLIPKEDIWEATTPNWSWARVIDGWDTLDNWAAITPSAQPANVCIFDNSWSTFDSCVFGL